MRLEERAAWISPTRRKLIDQRASVNYCDTISSTRSSLTRRLWRIAKGWVCALFVVNYDLSISITFPVKKYKLIYLHSMILLLIFMCFRIYSCSRLVIEFLESG